MSAIMKTALTALGESTATALLTETATSSALLQWRRFCAESRAIEMLKARKTRAETRDSLMRMYDISERTAYRIINEAMHKVCQKAV